MAGAPSYRFRFQIEDEATGEVVWTDFTYLMTDMITDMGDCDNVDIHVSSMLRGFRRHVREEYEMKNYAPAETGDAA